MASRQKRGGAWVWVLLVACFGGGVGAAALVRHQRDSVDPQPGDAPAKTVRRPSPAVRARVDELIAGGEANLRNERYSAALPLFVEASRLEPADPRPHIGLGKVHQAFFHDERARQAYETAIELDPTFWYPKQQLAKLLHDMGQYEEAMALVRAMEKEKPGASLVWAEIALNALQLGDTAEAIDLLKRYVGANNADAWGYAQLGHAYRKLGDLENAEAALKRAVAIKPTMSIAHYWLGQTLVSAGKIEESAQPLERYRELRQLETVIHRLQMDLLRAPDSIGTLVHLAEARWNLGERDESLATLYRARTLAPDDEKLGRLYEEMARRLETTRSSR